MKLIMENWKKFLLKEFIPPADGEKNDPRTKNATGAEGAANAVKHEWEKLGKSTQLELIDGVFKMSDRSGFTLKLSNTNEKEIKEVHNLAKKVCQEEKLSSEPKLFTSPDKKSASIEILNPQDFNMANDPG